MNRYPIRVRADLSDPPGRWLWLVKWLLLVPHYLVLAVLWVAYLALTVVAYVWVLVTGRYPEQVFAFNVGVLRWTWRVGYYGYQVLGTDRYPPFTLAEVPDYPAGLEADRPPAMPRWRPLVAWLFAIPHLMLLAVLTGGAWQATTGADGLGWSAPAGLVGVAVLVAAVALLFTGRYPRGLHDLLAGVGRWALRVVAYVSLLTGAYPPFRLDQGAREPDGDAGPSGPAPASGASGASGPAARVVAVVAGVLLLLVGAGVGTAGGLALALDGQRENGWVTSPAAVLSSPTAALVADGIVLHPDRKALERVGLGEVRFTASGDATYFLGIARQSDVEAWLAGTAYDRVVDPTGAPRRVGGPVTAVPPAGTRDFWLASASGTGTVTLDWTVADGRFAVVLANADGSTGVAADVRAAARIPDLTPLGAGLLTGGLLALGGGIALIVVGAAGLGGSGSAPRPPVTPPAPPAPPSVPRERPRVPEPVGPRA